MGDKPLYVYYCKYSGKHALTTDCNLAAAPRRRTDHAIVLDTQAHLAKLYTTDGGTKLLRRRCVCGVGYGLGCVCVCGWVGGWGKRVAAMPPCLLCRQVMR